MFKLMNNKKGFTLVELMIVVVIMAILVAVAVPIYNAVTENSKKKTCAANARILSAQVSQIMMGSVANTGGTNATAQGKVAGTTGTIVIDADTTFAEINTSYAAAAGTLNTLVQGGVPTCPVDNATETPYVYYVNAGGDGKVLCSHPTT